MAESVFPLQQTDVTPEQEPRVVSFDESGTMIEALANETARTILDALNESPKPKSDLAEEATTSLQNVTYHLDKLTDAGLVEVVDTHYSSRGLEMDVYATVSDPVVICLGDTHHDEAVSHVVASELDTEPASASSN